jgi:hypothetical protein
MALSSEAISLAKVYGFFKNAVPIKDFGLAI